MGAARSVDLRERVVAEVLAGASRRQAAARFKVSPSSAIRWTALERKQAASRLARAAGRAVRRWSHMRTGSWSLWSASLI
jgi:transposase